ncbi:MAG TPA: GTP-binding protein [Methanomicrobiales archaeon]|jgi:small GTP-binding protein|nr:GTP-binding protein [Methanomicrobiales archaeon]
MSGPEDEILAIEEEISSTPYNKATSKHIGRLKAKLAKIKDEAVQRALKAGGGGEGFSVKKSGDATAVLVGFPSTGKSTLLNTLTGTQSEVGSYAFTTVTVIPGALEHRSAKIQILDIPGMIAGAAMGKGRGKEVISVVRSADLIILLVDVWNEKHFDILIRELADAGIRINREKPDITIRKTSIGGVHVGSVGDIGMDDDEIKAIMAEYRLVNAHVLIRGGATQDDLIDTMLGNRIYVPAILAVNKVDLVDGATMRSIEEDLSARFGERPLMISAASGYHMEELKDAIFDHLGFIRAYMKPQGEDADLEEPMILRRNATVEDVCRKLHREFVEKFRYARIWGEFVKHAGQRVGLHYKVHDGDLISIITRR